MATATKYLNVYRRRFPGHLVEQWKPGATLYDTRAEAVEGQLKQHPTSWEYVQTAAVQVIWHD